MLPAQDRKRVAEAVTGHNWSIPPINPVHVFPVNRSVGAWEPETNAKHWQALVGFLFSYIAKHPPSCLDTVDDEFSFRFHFAIPAADNNIEALERLVLFILDRTEDV